MSNSTPFAKNLATTSSCPAARAGEEQSRTRSASADNSRRLLIHPPPVDLIEAVPYDAPNHGIACHPVIMPTRSKEGCRYDADASGGRSRRGDRRRARHRPRGGGTIRA